MSAQPAEMEKRSYPRVQLLRPVTLIDEHGANLKGNLKDISPDGLQAVCTLDAAKDLIEGAPGDRGQTRMKALFNLPVESEFLEVAVECRMCHVSQVPEEGVAIGLRFVGFSGDSLAHLRRFIVCSLEPA